MTEFRRFAVQAFVRSVVTAALITAATGATYWLRVEVWIPFFCADQTCAVSTVSP